MKNGMAPAISWDPSLGERLLRGLSLAVIGQLGLPEPLSRLVVLARSDSPPDGHMALAAILVPTLGGGTVALSPFGMGRPGATRIPPELADRFTTRDARGGGLYVLGDGAADFIVAHGIVRQITVSCGLWPLLLQLAGPRAPALPTTDASRVAADLDRFCEVVSAVVDAVYAHEEAPTPRAGLVLRPTGVSVDSALGGLRRLGTGAAGIFSRLPTASSAARSTSAVTSFSTASSSGAFQPSSFRYSSYSPIGSRCPHALKSLSGNVSRASRSSCVACPPIRNVSATSSAGPSPFRQRVAAIRVAAYASSTLLPSSFAPHAP